MRFLKALSIVLLTLFTFTGCDNEDETSTFSESDIWGVWVADKIPQSGYEAQGIEIKISEDRILQTADRVINPEDSEIVSENSFACLSYGELNVEDPVAGFFNFYFVENLSYPSQAADNIRVELLEDGARAVITTKIFNWDGSETFVEYEVERSSNEIPSIDFTSCASQE